MKRQGFYLLFFIPAFTACLDSPEMTTGIVNEKEKPTVRTISKDNPISEDGSLLFQGEIVSEGKSEIKEKGFYWSTDSNDPGINGIYDSITAPYVKTDVFTCELKNISEEKKYYWRAYAKNSFGLDYGMVDSCQTPKYKPTVTTLPTNNPLDDGILLFQGEIISTGKAPIIEKGFYWSTVSREPDENDSTITVSDPVTGIFEHELNGATGEKTYYWRSFAKNAFGHELGDVQSFETHYILKDKRSLNAIARGTGAIFVIDDKIYISCGDIESYSFQPTNETWVYSIATDDWDQPKALNGDARSFPVAFTIGNLAFVGTGRSASGTYKDFYQYNSTLNEWTEIATLDDFEARYQAIAFSLNGKGYVVGGTVSSVRLKDVWQYDVVDNSWVKKIDFYFDFSGGISIQGNNRAFVGFGDTPETARTLWEYDEANDEWIEFATLPDEVKTKIYSGVIVRNTIYIIDKNNVIWTCDMSDEIKTWKEKIDLSNYFLNTNGEILNQMLFTTGNSSSIYIGLEYTKKLYEYYPLWDN